MIPTPRLWLLLLALAAPAMAAGFFPELWPVLLLLDAAALALALADGMVARSTPLELTRRLPAKPAAGVPLRVELSLRARGRGALVWVTDELPDEVDTTELPLRTWVPARSEQQLSYLATPTRRGRLELGELHARVQGPLGLVQHERTFPARTPLHVLPDMRGASRLLLATAAVDLVNLGIRRLRQDGGGSEFSRLRDYARGDSLRDVDWKATARRLRPVSRVRESERSQSILLCVDTGRGMAARVDALTKLDHAVNAALFLAFVALRNGDRVGVLTFSSRVQGFLAPASGRGQYRRIAELLYGTHPELTFVDYDALYRELSARAPKRHLVCLFTDVLDEDQGEALTRLLGRVRRRHAALCLWTSDAQLPSLLEEEPLGPEGPYLHAAAAEVLSERETLKGALRRHGVHLVDVPAADLSVAAVNEYLAIKDRALV